MSGKASKAEAITDGEDLVAAKSQSEAMDKAKKRLRAAVEEALKANKGYRGSVWSLSSGMSIRSRRSALPRARSLKTVEEMLE